MHSEHIKGTIDTKLSHVKAGGLVNPNIVVAFHVTRNSWTEPEAGLLNQNESKQRVPGDVDDVCGRLWGKGGVYSFPQSLDHTFQPENVHIHLGYRPVCPILMGDDGNSCFK